MWQGSQNLHATQKESRAQNELLSAVGYISDTEEIIQAPWSLFQHDGAAAFKSSERSPLPLPLSANYCPGEWTQILNVHRIRRINCHAVEHHEQSAPESISHTENWLNWNGDLYNLNVSGHNCAVDVESVIEQDNWIEDPECPEQCDVSADPNVPRLIRPTEKSRRQAEKVLMTVNAIETRRNSGVKTK